MNIGSFFLLNILSFRRLVVTLQGQHPNRVFVFFLLDLMYARPPYRKCMMLRFAAACSVLLFSCASQAKFDGGHERIGADEESVKQDTILDARGRLNYKLEHLWDTWSFSDTTALNWKVGEQHFADFVDMLRYADSVTAQRVVKHYIEQGFANDDLRGRYDVLIHHYLGSADSPLRNDVVYVYFLREMLPYYDPATEMTRKERATFQLSMAMKNNPGMSATDFEFVDRDGRKGRLSEVEGELIVLVFNDPDCEKCQRLMPQLISEPRLRRTGITVLSIYPDEDTEQWQHDRRPVPDNWIDAYSPNGAIIQQALYSLPVLPSIYLLDGHHRVLMKDVSPQLLMHVLDRRFGE